MFEPTHYVLFTLSNGTFSVNCESREEAVKIKTAVLARRNDPAKKGDLYVYQKGEEEFSLFVSTVQCVAIGSISSGYDSYYQKYYNERLIQDQVDELIFTQKYGNDFGKKEDKKPDIEQSEKMINDATRSLRRVETLNRVCDSFANMVAIMADLVSSDNANMDPGIKVQFEKEIGFIKKDLATISGENNA